MQKEREIRVAFFPDSYFEVNGVANTARNFESYARVQGLPMLLVAASNRNYRTQDGSITRYELRRGSFSFGVEKDLRFDLGFLRHYRRLTEAVREFAPDVVHITGPSDVGIAGLLVARDLKIPLVASWHTNLHEYAGRRAATLIPGFLRRHRHGITGRIEAIAFKLCSLYYSIAQLHFAPNGELINLLKEATGKPCFLMSRGVDPETFNPKRRTRTLDDDQIVIGYVGRLSTEKNVRMFATLETLLKAAGVPRFKFVFVGHGSEEEWLRQNIAHAEFTGVLRGRELGQAYANFDIFAFPSETDTFGNVVLEAIASGVPAVVTDSGGPRWIVDPGKTGLVCKGPAEFGSAVVRLATDRQLRKTMSVAARESALQTSWDRVFDSVYDGYCHLLKLPVRSRLTTAYAPSS